MNLFLDDYRLPEEAAKYMYMELGSDNLKYIKDAWFVVRNYNDFVTFIRAHGMPNHISFDHDLGKGHYHKNYTGTELDYAGDFGDEKTGWHAAHWLINYHMDNQGPWPTWWVHSMNPVGKDNIKSLLKNYEYVYKLTTN